jgi:short-subunit dehydrogenase
MAIDTVKRYGRWGVVAGASEGLGAAFADALAARGHDLVLLARRKAVLTQVAEDLRARHKVTVRLLACDLADASFATALRAVTDELDVGIGIYNAAFSYVAPLLDRPVEESLRIVDVNCRGPLLLTHALGPGMVSRRRGALVLMASIAGFTGSAALAAYAASKAFNIVLGQSLWVELKPHGIDVLTSCAGAIRTPNYGRTGMREAPGTMDASDVAERTLATLGSGPIYVPGMVNKLASVMLGRLLTRRRALKIMSDASRSLS